MSGVSLRIRDGYESIIRVISLNFAWPLMGVRVHVDMAAQRLPPDPKCPSLIQPILKGRNTAQEFGRMDCKRGARCGHQTSRIRLWIIRHTFRQLVKKPPPMN